LELQNHVFFISAVGGDDWPPSYPGLNNAVERTTPTLLTKGAMGFRACRDGGKTYEFSSTLEGSDEGIRRTDIICLLFSPYFFLKNDVSEAGSASFFRIPATAN